MYGSSKADLKDDAQNRKELIQLCKETLDFLSVVTNTIADAPHQLDILWVTNLVAIV